jgi:hypothetical protein
MSSYLGQAGAPVLLQTQTANPSAAKNGESALTLVSRRHNAGLKELGDSLALLEQRLTPILTPRAPTEAKDGKVPPRVQQSAIFEAVNEWNNCLEAGVAFIHEILGRLEI